MTFKIEKWVFAFITLVTWFLIYSHGVQQQIIRLDLRIESLEKQLTLSKEVSEAMAIGKASLEASTKEF